MTPIQSVFDFHLNDLATQMSSTPRSNRLVADSNSKKRGLLGADPACDSQWQPHSSSRFVQVPQQKTGQAKRNSGSATRTGTWTRATARSATRPSSPCQASPQVVSARANHHSRCECALVLHLTWIDCNGCVARRWRNTWLSRKGRLHRRRSQHRQRVYRIRQLWCECVRV